jgi:hypothetical protein
MEAFRHHIVCVGCNDYDDPLIPNLNWARADALELAEAWHQYENAVIDAEHVLVGARFLVPARSNVLASLDSIQKKLSDQDVLWFSFSGHGVVTNDEHRLLLADTRLSRQKGSFDLLEQTSLEVSLLVRYLRRSKAGYIVMLLDCCVDVVPDSERSLLASISKLDLGQDIARIGVLWSQRAKESLDLEHGALTKAWLNTLLAPERLEEPKHQTVSVYFQSLRAKYEELRHVKMNLPSLDIICNADRWHIPTLKAKAVALESPEKAPETISFRFDFPAADTDGRFVNFACGVCSAAEERKDFTYYAVLEDRASALYCQYPPVIIDEQGRWRVERVVVGHGITNLHIVEADVSLTTELQSLDSQNYYGALPRAIASKLEMR